MLKMMIVNGMVNGGIISILAVGFSLVFGVARILNMAHTAFYMVAAYFTFFAISIFGIPLLFSCVFAVLLTGILGIICYTLAFDRVKEHETTVMIISVAVAMLLQEGLLLTVGAQFRGIPRFIDGFAEVVGVRIPYQHLIAIGVSLLTLIGVWILLSKTKLGITIRSVAQDREVANLMGMNVSRICMISMGISAVLAGIAGVIVGPIYSVSPLMWISPLTIVLAAVVLGGLGSVKGSVLASFILGFIQSIVIFVIPNGSYLKDAVALGIMLVGLLLRPEGIFGVTFEEERL